jgi:thymidylate synthase (FAD)
LGKKVKVTLIASTSIHGWPLKDYMGTREWLLPNPNEPTYGADFLAEFAGRACYQSWNRPNAKTATNATYIEHIVDVGHYSVLEHASATFYVEGVSRSLTHELVRHRHLSYSQLSQRYVDESDTEFVKPSGLGDFDPAAELLDGEIHRESDSVTGYFYDLCISIRDVYTTAVEELLKRGMTRKEARQAARAILPNMTETKIVVTGNMRAWRDMLSKRWHVAADAEIREFAGMILEQLRSIAPNTFADIPGRPYGSHEE